MAAVFASGLMIALEIGIALLFSIIGLFFGHIILFDSIALSILGGVLSYHFLGVHPVLAIVIGIAILALIYWVQSTKFGFWIIGGSLSVVWGFIFAFIAYDVSGKSMMWTYIVWGLGALIMMGLHMRSRNKMALE